MEQIAMNHWSKSHIFHSQSLNQISNLQWKYDTAYRFCW